MDDDRAMVVNVQEKGLVVISGCAHSGIVNTVLHARRITGVDDVRAIVGGSHLGRATGEEMGRTVVELQAMGSRVVMPAHGTGFAALRLFTEKMLEEFVFGAVALCWFLECEAFLTSK